MEINENNFISQIKCRNQDALAYAVKNYGGLMRSVISRVLYNYPQDSEECLYDAIMKIWNNIVSYDESMGCFSSWAAAIAKYCALDRLRKLMKIQPEAEITEEMLADRLEISDSSGFNEFFYELVDCLNEEDRLLFAQIFLYGETIGEAAVRSGKSKAVIYNRISRAKKRIIKRRPELLKGENE